MDELLELLDKHSDLRVGFRNHFDGKYIVIIFSRDVGVDAACKDPKYKHSDYPCKDCNYIQKPKTLSQLITREDFEAFFDVILHNMEDKFYEETE